MITPIVIKKSKRKLKSSTIESKNELRNCCLCQKQLSMYNKNKYDLCHICLSKVQQAVDDIPDSKFANVLLQMRGDIHNTSKSNKRKGKVKHVDDTI